MGRVLLYPLLVLVALCLIACVVLTALATIEHNRRHHALRHPKWEVFAEPTEGGQVEVGVQLMAKWCGNEQLIRRDPKTARVAIEDTVEFAIVKAQAKARADAYNLATEED
jgi:hypothetical protein